MKGQLICATFTNILVIDPNYKTFFEHNGFFDVEKLQLDDVSKSTEIEWEMVNM